MLPLNKTQIPQVFRKALALEQAGNLDEARNAYLDVVRIDRNHAPAHFKLGQIALKSGDMAGALKYLERATDLAPQEKATWALLARAARQSGDPVIAEAVLKKARKSRIDRATLLELQNFLRPPKAAQKTRTKIGSAPPEEIRRAIGLLQAGRATEAERVAQRLRDAHPDVAIIADILAGAQAAQGKIAPAESNYRAAIALDPNYAEAHSNFGRFLVEQGRLDEGIAQLRAALELAPKLMPAWVHLGVALRRQHNARGAIAAFRKALEVDPNHPEALVGMGEVLAEEARPAEAVEFLSRALESGADKAETTITLARCKAALGQEEEALQLLASILPDAPVPADVLAARAMILQTLGRFDEARDAFREAIALNPRAGHYYRTFLTTEKLPAGDPLIARMEAAFADPEIPDFARVNFGFALAKAMEDTGQHDRVFTYLRPANELMRKLYPFDFDALRDQTLGMLDVLRDVDFESIDIPGRSDYAPIFVTGLPRSGTTLVEQIVASHSEVTGGGELGNARRVWNDLLIDKRGAYRPWDSIDPDSIAAAGHLIEKQMRAMFGDAPRVTDKSVQSYSMIGPIRVSLPNARFVVVRRDPRDNLLSMYKNMFAPGKHLYSYDLRDLARYYRLFEEIMEFWRAKVPGWFHEIRYEELIADPETEARKLIAACGLDWEDACLNFHQNKRRVDTLSVHQVRQPIYKSSMAGWKRHEAELNELLEELGGEYAAGA